MSAKKTPRARKARGGVTLRAALRTLTDAQSAQVRYTFPDGTAVVMDAKTVKDTLERQVLALRRIQGAEGGRPTKAPADIQETILLKFGEYWLKRSESHSFFRAQAHARAWIVGELVFSGIKERTARRWVREVLGKKTPIPKRK